MSNVFQKKLRDIQSSIEEKESILSNMEDLDSGEAWAIMQEIDQLYAQLDNLVE